LVRQGKQERIRGVTATVRFGEALCTEHSA
jgi:hypothetical protein